MNIEIVTREDLVNLLKTNDEIRRIIKEIVLNNDNTTKMSTEVEDLIREIEDLKKDNQLLIKQISELEQSEIKNINEYQSKITEAERLSEEYRQQICTLKSDLECFSDVSKLWRDFDRIEPSQKEYVINLCGSNNLYALISLGREYNKLKQLAIAVKNFAINDREYGNEKFTLNWYDRYLRYSVSLYNDTTINDYKYEILNVEIDTDFDSSICDKTSCSNYGVISDMIISGYKRSDGDVLLLPIVKTK